MNNFEFLKKYQKLQYTIMFDKLIDLDFAIISYSKTDKTSFWNNALTDRILRVGEVLEIEKTLRTLERTSALYFENRKDLLPLTELLKDKGYKQDFEDSWMFYKGEQIDKRLFGSIKKVTNKEELRGFLSTFDACYQKNDPQNPYGELGDYLKVTEEVWYRHNKADRIEYFVAYQGDKRVAVSTLTNYGGIGYISNVGSLREVRGKGYGKTVTMYCVKRSQDHGNKDHCLATEEGTYPNEFYKRVGFNTRFTAVGYVKKN